ncbi:MAG: S49 family peptidase [Deferribacterales bacterium]
MNLYLTSDNAAAEAVHKLLSTHTEVTVTDGVTVEDLDIINGVAVIRVAGLLTPYRYWESTMYTGMNFLRAKLQYAANSPDVREIVLEIDSPGGAAVGIDETAAYIRKISETKKVTAFVSGVCASAAYWLACACSEIVATRTGQLGSIGVVISMFKMGDFIATVTSKQSPNKSLTLETDEGKKLYQQRADDLADIFINAVAEYRKMKAEEVIKAGDSGNVLIASKAVENGLADRISTLNELLNIKNTEDNNIMDINELKEKHKSVYAQAAADGVEAEKKRQSDIRALSLPGYEDLIEAALNDTKQTAAAVSVEMIQRQKTKGKDVLKTLKQKSEDAVLAVETDPAAEEPNAKAVADAKAEDGAYAFMTGGK